MDMANSINKDDPSCDSLATRVPALTPEQYCQMVSYAAYFRAESRGFEPNKDWEDWFAAEQEVNLHLNGYSE